MKILTGWILVLGTASQILLTTLAFRQQNEASQPDLVDVSNGVNKSYHKKFVFLTTLYNEKNEQRRSEYLTCLEKNLAHPSIEKVHVIYDQSKDDQENHLLQYLKAKKVDITYISERPTYSFCFNLVNNTYPLHNIILSNADIFFNETLFLLDSYPLTNHFLALTRWEVRGKGAIEPYIWPNGQNAVYSQDAWIFESPIRPFFSEIQLGTPGCDGKIAKQAFSSGLKVINPCQSIQACHVHLSKIRNYGPGNYSMTELMPVAWTKLETCSHCVEKEG